MTENTLHDDEEAEVAKYGVNSGSEQSASLLSMVSVCGECGACWQ